MLLRTIPTSAPPWSFVCRRCAARSTVAEARAHLPTRSFSATALRSTENAPNHYEVLRISPTATQAELKKQFYVLSKETHPDVNPDHADAGKRFAQVSESYSVLADPEKRRRYDRDVMRTQHAHHRGSHSSRQSGSYAGSRPASGLSKRRSAFKGPPPSFYAHGTFSANTARQTQAGGGQYTAGTFNAGAYMDPGQWDPAFDPRSTYKTQSHEDYRRASRRAAEMAAAQQEVAEDNFWMRFVIVSSMIALTIAIGTVVVSSRAPARGGLTRSDGSRRDGVKNEWTKG